MLASEIVYLRHIIMRIKQGCDLNKITRSSKVLNHEILAAQDYSLSENSKFFSHPRAKDSCMWHTGISRTQP